jgi:hypothetical protein
MTTWNVWPMARSWLAAPGSTTAKPVRELVKVLLVAERLLWVQDCERRRREATFFSGL